MKMHVVVEIEINDRLYDTNRDWVVTHMGRREFLNQLLLWK